MQPSHVQGVSPRLDEFRLGATGEQCLSAERPRPVFHLVEEHNVRVADPEWLLFVVQQRFDPLALRVERY